MLFEVSFLPDLHDLIRDFDYIFLFILNTNYKIRETCHENYIENVASLCFKSKVKKM